MAGCNINRRSFIKKTFAAVAGCAPILALAGQSSEDLSGSKNKNRPNFLLIITDQLGLDAISGHGCKYVKTPNIDRLIKNGTTFIESHSTSPVCSPARSSIFTGRMPCETGVISNDRQIDCSVPNFGQWLSNEGYNAVYCGKWHLPNTYPVDISGFNVIPVGHGQGCLVDSVVSCNCVAFLKNYNDTRPFFLTASLMQPHDICYWAINHELLVPEDLPFEKLVNELPPLPPNQDIKLEEPKVLKESRVKYFSKLQWQYYSYIYYRQAEMADADVGRVLDALEDSGHADNTIVIFTSDHGEGLGRHQMVQKWYPYDESMKVPLIFSGPGVKKGIKNKSELICGLDIAPTICDLANIRNVPDCRGLSLRPLLQGKKPEHWKEYVQADTQAGGKILRTSRYKYVQYPNDPIMQFFDMKNDPWETKNLIDDPRFAAEINRHKQLLSDWLKSLKPVTSTLIKIQR